MADSAVPGQIDWKDWVARFDRMQDRYLAHRRERFEVIVRILRKTQPADCRVIDLGCGTGSLTEAILDALPESRVIGVDLDGALLLLAEQRLQRFGNRAKLVKEDLRGERWVLAVNGPQDGVVSSTALHWLSPDNLAMLYYRLTEVLKPGGVFLNADHVASSEPAVQREWEEHRQADLARSRTHSAEGWDEFFAAYSKALGANPATMGSKVVGTWQGIEEGLPLAWHVDQLQKNGFVSCDCFWRCDCDAIYGAFRQHQDT